ncbi:MAG: hypothetical protein IJ343_09965 [Clostridia bacterium]|nr:hypothetical protein [Clostridia bacterium]
MKIRKLADAAIVAALLLTSVPDLDPSLTPEALLAPAACEVAAPQPDTSDNPASREPSTI